MRARASWAWSAIASLGAHAALVALPVGVLDRAAAERPPAEGDTIGDAFLAFSLASPTDEGQKREGGGDQGGEPATPPAIEARAPRPGARDARERSPAIGVDRDAARAWIASMREGAATLRTDPRASSPYIARAAREVEASAASALEARASALESIGHAPARGCARGACDGIEASGPALADLGGAARAAAGRSRAAGAWSGRGPCAGMHVCWWQRLPRSSIRVDVEVRGALASEPRATLASIVRRAAARCAHVASDGEPGPRALAIGVDPSGAVRTIEKLDGAREDDPRHLCVADALRAARFPEADGPSAIRATLTLRP